MPCFTWVLSYPASIQTRLSAVQLSHLPHRLWPATPLQSSLGLVRLRNPQAAGPMCFLNEDEEVWTLLHVTDVPQCMAAARAPSAPRYYTQCQNSLGPSPCFHEKTSCFPACIGLLWSDLELATESQTIYQRKHLAACSAAQPESIPV